MPDEFGIFSERDRATHHHCEPLCAAIIDLLKGRREAALVDYGCGPGSYVEALRNAGFNAIGVDGSPDERPFLIDGNLCLPLHILPMTRKTALCLEVGEHIPADYTGVFLDNITREADTLVMSWAVRGQGGVGHVNCLDNIEVQVMLQERGFTYDQESTGILRAAVVAGKSCVWFAKTIMVFHRARIPLVIPALDIITLGTNKHFPCALLLDPITSPRPFGCGALQLAAKTIGLTRIDHHPILIVEDDTTPTEWHTNYINVPYDADVVYLGLSQWCAKAGGGLTREGPTVEPCAFDDLVRVRTMLATHAILYMTRHGLEWSRRASLQCFLQKRPTDVMLSESMGEVNVYAFKKPPFYQGPKGNRNAGSTNFCLP